MIPFFILKKLPEQVEKLKNDLYICKNNLDSHKNEQINLQNDVKKIENIRINIKKEICELEKKINNEMK